MTVTVFYPSLDGYTGVTDQGATFANLRSASGSASPTGGAAWFYQIKASTTTNRYDHCRRAYCLFDTSSIGAPATVSAATFGFIGDHTDAADGVAFINDFADSMSLVNANPASDDDLVNADFGNLGTTIQAPNLLLSGLTIDQNTVSYFTLNAAGVATVQAARTGISKFGILSTRDLVNNEPTWGSADQTHLAIYSMEESESGEKRPRLTVTHTSPFTPKVIMF
tara:strand:+ start:258 stop:929 length:672 start_codon:yes stop_codon:yes gene_type:complete